MLLCVSVWKETQSCDNILHFSLSEDLDISGLNKLRQSTQQLKSLLTGHVIFRLVTLPWTRVNTWMKIKLNPTLPHQLKHNANQFLRCHARLYFFPNIIYPGYSFFNQHLFIQLRTTVEVFSWAARNSKKCPAEGHMRSTRSPAEVWAKIL